MTVRPACRPPPSASTLDVVRNLLAAAAIIPLLSAAPADANATATVRHQRIVIGDTLVPLTGKHVAKAYLRDEWVRTRPRFRIPGPGR